MWKPLKSVHGTLSKASKEVRGTAQQPNKPLRKGMEIARITENIYSLLLHSKKKSLTTEEVVKDIAFANGFQSAKEQGQVYIEQAKNLVNECADKAMIVIDQRDACLARLK